jgi:predicted signal transduction protein with EAL and GGDEF domain
MARPQRIDQLDLRVTVGMGIGVYPDDGTDAGTLLKNADRALLRAKAAGRGNTQRFEPDISAGTRVYPTWHDTKDNNLKPSGIEPR